MSLDLDRLRRLLELEGPGTWIAVNAAGDLRVVVPKGPQGQYTLAHPRPASTYGADR